MTTISKHGICAIDFRLVMRPLLFFTANRSAHADSWIHRLGRSGFGCRINSASPDLGAELARLVIQTFVLQSVTNDALNIETRFAERHRLGPFVQFERESSAPLHHAAGSGVIGGGDVFDASVLVDLILEKSCAQLNIQTRFE